MVVNESLGRFLDPTTQQRPVLGGRVRLRGLQAKPELNGCTGSCIEYLEESGRWSVRLDDGVVFSFREEDLEYLSCPLSRLVLASVAIQGMRSSQEDRHVKIPDIIKAARALKLDVGLEHPSGFAAVYDGHQGQCCADFAAKNLHMRLLRKLAVSASESGKALEPAAISEVLSSVCTDLDNEYLSRYRTALDGCTALVGLVAGARLFVAWAGDSRAIMCRRGTDGEAIVDVLTEDHRATSLSEAQRVRDAGGSIVDVGDGCWRVAQGDFEERCREITRAEQQGLGLIGKMPVALAVSRSLGDRAFKAVTRGKDLVTAVPELRVVELDKDHEFVVFVSDGVTDVLTNDEVVNLVDSVLDSRSSNVARTVDEENDVARSACQSLLQEALRRGSGDNVTAVVVQFRWADQSREPAVLHTDGLTWQSPRTKRPRV